jgi:hypothetical protein
LIDAQKIRDLYLEHFGSVAAERAAGTEAAPFVLLELDAISVIENAYATLGASHGPLQHEIWLVAAERFPPFGAAVEAVVRAAPVLAPGLVLPHAIPGTPFTALLCLPFDDVEGSFALGKAGAAPHAFQLAPLTAAEQALAEQDPGRVTDLLRAAYAFTADRFRGCLVDVPPPPPAARTEVAQRRRQARVALLALQANMLRQHGPREPPGGMSPRRRRRYVRLPAGAANALTGAVKHAIREALAPYVRHPAPVAYLFAEFMYVTLATHPDAVRLLDRMLDPRNLPGPVAGAPAPEAAAACRRVLEALAIAIARSHPGESEAALLARGGEALREALATFDPADEIPLENHVWAAALPAMYQGLADLQRPAVRGVPRVFRRAAQSEAMLELDLDPRPPLVRLQEIVPRLATELVTAYAAGLRGQLPA